MIDPSLALSREEIEDPRKAAGSSLGNGIPNISSKAVELTKRAEASVEEETECTSAESA